MSVKVEVEVNETVANIGFLVHRGSATEQYGLDRGKREKMVLSPIRYIA
ncbi:hypothetical protein PP707_08035 [Acetobacter pasteurianus]|nr:hypothetical protein [Acetobacter pasteurianus]